MCSLSIFTITTTSSTKLPMSSLTTTSFIGSYLMYRQHVLIQLYSLHLGRLVSPSLFRLRYFQKARYGYYPSVFIWLWAEVWPQDAWWCCNIAADELSKNHDAHKPPGWYGNQHGFKHTKCSYTELQEAERNNQDCMSCASAEWMDGCGAASAASAEARMWIPMCSRLCRTTTAL